MSPSRIHDAANAHTTAGHRSIDADLKAPDAPKMPNQDASVGARAKQAAVQHRGGSSSVDSFGGTSAAAAVGRADSMPKTWVKLEPAQGAAEFAHIVKDDESLFYRTADGLSIQLAADDHRALVQRGDLTLYKNPKGRQGDPSDDSGAPGAWFPSYYMVIDPRGALADVSAILDSQLRKANSAKKGCHKAIDEFAEVNHPSRVQPEKSPDMPVIKAEIRAALGKVEKVLADFDAMAVRWDQQAAELLARDLTADQKKLVEAALVAGAPARLDGVVPQAKAMKSISKLCELILDRPEVVHVGFGAPDGVEVDVDASTLVANGGTMQGYTKALKHLCRDNGITGNLSVYPLQTLEPVAELIVSTILAPAIGANNVVYQGIDTASVSFGVKRDVLAQAKDLAPAIRDLLQRYVDAPAKVSFSAA